MKTLVKRYMNYMEYYGRIKSRRILLDLSDRQLEDAGFSKELLLKGTREWPWHVSEDPTPLTELAKRNDIGPALIGDKEYNQAVADLEHMSDSELLDMGISRGEIRHAVKYGMEDKAA